MRLRKAYPENPQTGECQLLRASQDRTFKKFPNNGGELLSNQYQSEPLKSKELSTNTLT